MVSRLAQAGFPILHKNLLRIQVEVYKSSCAAAASFQREMYSGKRHQIRKFLKNCFSITTWIFIRLVLFYDHYVLLVWIIKLFINFLRRWLLMWANDWPLTGWWSDMNWWIVTWIYFFGTFSASKIYLASSLLWEMKLLKLILSFLVRKILHQIVAH